MSERHLISVQELCRCYELDISIMVEFADVGLYTPLIQEEEWFLDSEELPELESLIRLFQTFKISPEGLDVIRHLRRQVIELRDQVRRQEHRLEALQKRSFLLESEIEDLL